MIDKSPEFAAALATVDSKVIDGHVFVDIETIIDLNDGLAYGIIYKSGRLDPMAANGMTFVMGLYKSIYEALVLRHAADVVPDDLGGLDGIG